jgi:hypothetical protein
MKNIIRITGLGAVVLALACSSMNVNHDWDRDANFGSYQTYAWAAQPASAPQNAQQAQSRNDLLDKRVRRAIDDQMVAKGFSENPAGADIMLVYHTGAQDKINVTDWGYRYSYDYWGWGGRDIDVYQYTEGTLVVDMIDSGTKELVWRGSATKTIDSNPTPEKMESNIQKAVAAIFQNYPPRGK